MQFFDALYMAVNSAKFEKKGEKKGNQESGSTLKGCNWLQHVSFQME